MLVTLAAVAGSAVAIKFAHDTREAFSDVTLLSNAWSRKRPIVSPPMSLEIMPPVLSTIAVLLLCGGAVAWCLGRFPGYRWTCSAIDWSNVGDVMRRLLAVGCTYPEALDTAAEVARTSSNRCWLKRAAEHVRQGASLLPQNSASDGDAAVVETLLETTQTEPSERWRMAQEHFDEVAGRRVDLLQATVPIVSTLLAGLLIWMSISTTLGWMWMAIGRMFLGLAF